MGRTRHYPWQEAYATALRESDSCKAVARIEEAAIALERRRAQWGMHPGTQAELKAIRGALATLRRTLKEKRSFRHAS